MKKSVLIKGLNLKKINPRRINKSVKRETKLPITIVKNLIQITYIVLKYIFVKLSTTTKKEICQETVGSMKSIKDFDLGKYNTENEVNTNVVNFTDYKLKKAQ